MAHRFLIREYLWSFQRTLSAFPRREQVVRCASRQRQRHDVSNLCEERSASLRYLMDHTDDPVIPRRGFRWETSFHWFDSSPGATSSFPVLDARVEFFQPVSRAASFFLSSEGGSTLGSRNTGVPQFFLGGAPRLSAYGVNELFGNQYYLFRGGYLHEIVSLPPFVGKKVYAIGSYEAGKMYGAVNESKFPNDFAAGVLAETALGPFFVGGSVGDSGH